jgi:phage tail sheath protein FI
MKNKLMKDTLYKLGVDLRNIMDSILEDAESIKINLGKIAFDYNPLLQNIVNEIYKELSKIPPSGAVCGVYAMVDNQRGVWKAPANVSLATVSKPIVKIDDAQQEDLNVDVIGGKSINAIRSFTGKGTLVWGARTLAGNDNEWRYISVRRFFNMVEESIRNATGWAVFEPNDASTWIRVKAMIENYLTNLWKAGAMAGASSDQAFFVNIGMGTTMSQVDILEGRMNVEIGMAVVRPAEFIVLKFSHKMQES